jgi:surfeit locus 1 family protein
MSATASSTQLPSRAGRQRWVLWSATLGLSALTAGLGVWQWGRAETKDAQVAAARALQHAPAWGHAQWPCLPATNLATALASTSTTAAPAPAITPAPGELPRFQPARLSGEWLNGLSVWLDNRPMDGRAGFILVTPLRLSSPASCAGQVVLVERGWAPRHLARRDQLPALPVEAGLVTVQGHIEPALSAAYALGAEPDVSPTWPASPPIRQNADAGLWQRWLARASRGQDVAWQLSPGALRQHGAAPAGLLRTWPMGWQGTPPDRHRAYAAQWAAMSLLSLGLGVWFLLIRPHRHDPDLHAHTLHA